MEFQYDPQHRRHVEGWNIICHKCEDKIGLMADEYNELVWDFLNNSMFAEAEECCNRGIRLGSARSIALLGLLREKQGKQEEAYQLYRKRHWTVIVLEFVLFLIFTRKARMLSEILNERKC